MAASSIDNSLDLDVGLFDIIVDSPFVTRSFVRSRRRNLIIDNFLGRAIALFPNASSGILSSPSKESALLRWPRSLYYGIIHWVSVQISARSCKNSLVQ